MNDTFLGNVNYIISFYNGKRRHYSGKSNWRTFLDSHINFIKNNMIDIGMVTFVVSWSKDNSVDDNEMIRYIESLRLPFNYEIYTRVNGGFSYGSFADVIKKNYNDYDYSFVIEDDYIPALPNFMEYFLKKFEGQVVYVPSLYINDHASICNGMIDNVLLRGHINLLGDYIGNDYLKGGTQNQLRFMKEYESIGYQYNDITDTAYTEFLHISGKIIKYGNENGPLIMKPLRI